jgi:DNA modification methylase
MLFTRFSRGDSKGKNLDALNHSRKLRQDFKTEFGCIPRSILVRDPTDKAIDPSAKDRGYIRLSRLALKENDGISDRKLQSAFETAYRGVRGKPGDKKTTGMALSRFPQNIGRILVKFYCPKGGIVYDPFAGHNSRMQLTFEAGRSYIGYDISKQFMEHNRAIRDILLQNQKGSLIQDDTFIDLNERSSHDTGLDNEIADFTVTSPPYWDIEYYGDEPEQLGNTKTYDAFLEKIGHHIVENYRALKSGAFCCWCINDFRKGGKFYPYHADLIPIFEDAGFVLWTIYIIDLGEPAQNAFVRPMVQRMAFHKSHEYCLVFKKG